MMELNQSKLVMFKNFKGKSSEMNETFFYIKTLRVQNLKNQNIERFIFLKTENGFCEENQKCRIKDQVE